MNDIFTDKWIKGIAYEVAFWNNVYRWKRTFRGMMGWSHYGSVIELEEFDANSFLAGKESPVILDVGCGMSYATGNLISRNGTETPADIRYVDPLAPYFNRILRRYRRGLPEITFGMMEYLSAFYPEQDVDLVIIQNALDHSANPVKGIMEALETLRTGGILYLNHHPNEGETENYKGFHQYNITDEDGKLIIWNRDERSDINALIKDFADISVSRSAQGHVIAVITKTAGVPPHLTEDRKDKRRLCEDLIMQTMQTSSIAHAVKARCRYWKFNAIQFVAQALPWETRMKVKKLIKQA